MGLQPALPRQRVSDCIRCEPLAFESRHGEQITSMTVTRGSDARVSASLRCSTLAGTLASLSHASHGPYADVTKSESGKFRLFKEVLEKLLQTQDKILVSCSSASTAGRLAQLCNGSGAQPLQCVAACSTTAHDQFSQPPVSPCCLSVHVSRLAVDMPRHAVVASASTFLTRESDARVCLLPCSQLSCLAAVPLALPCSAILLDVNASREALAHMVSRLWLGRSAGCQQQMLTPKHNPPLA